MRKRFRGNQAAIMVCNKHQWPLSDAYSTLLTGQRAAREKKGRRRGWALTHLSCASGDDDAGRTRVAHGRSLINPFAVLPSLVPHNHTLLSRHIPLHSTIIRPTIILRNVAMSATAGATATHTGVPPLVAPLKVLPPAKDIPLTFTAGIKSWWEAGTRASAHAEERLLRYASGNDPPLHIAAIPNPLILVGNSHTTAPNLLNPSQKYPTNP